MIEASELHHIATLHAGGPGSGRHSGYGKFKRTTNDETTNTDSWFHPGSGTHVHITDSETSKGPKTKVRQNSKVVHEGTSESAHDFVLRRYGINDEE
jgi:hypothetical protein